MTTAVTPGPFDFPRLSRYFSERSPQPMVAVEGATHVIRYLNPAFARLVGKPADKLMDRPLAEAVPEGAENGCLALLGRVFRTGTHENLAEQEHRQAQPRPVYWSYAVWAILGADELPAGVMVHVTDATEVATFRARATGMNGALMASSVQQHELAAAAAAHGVRLQAAVKARDHFLAVLSHEIRNPLASLSNGLQLLKLAENDAATAESSRAMMDRQLTQLVRLVDDLLDISRISTGKLALRKERVDLAAVLGAAVEASRPLIESGGHELTVTPPPEPVWLDADPIRLSQVFQNLLNNAAKYSEPGGRIRLSVELASGGCQPPEVAVSVRDTGIGIDAAHLPHVFEVFVQVDTSWQQAQGGMGIGLSLVKEFVGLHGGRVEARSAGRGTGSEFVVYLPAATAHSRRGRQPGFGRVAGHVVGPDGARRADGPRRGGRGGGGGGVPAGRRPDGPRHAPLERVRGRDAHAGGAVGGRHGPRGPDRVGRRRRPAADARRRVRPSPGQAGGPGILD